MAIIKCKMCGGDVELTADKTFGTCEYCGCTMTFPKVDEDEQRAAAFNRGNHFRRIGEFDKALQVYERIVRENEADAEAHWCCALCRFGIEYVEDPTTFEWLPTCHRASFDSFLEDVDYLAAVEHSDGITRRQYQKDAAKIAEVQRGILAASQSAEPFDVFICYKESDENGDRTRDSLLAQDIYYQLTEQGRKVFFARITLEDMAGKQYEPYIFAALHSAKVMVVVGTKPEHLSAVWVKNEWSRFLAMMKTDHSKLLLPCYRDMDPYDMPEQLSVLQSYDMSKIGFIQDLIRGISKVLDAEKKPAVVKETVVAAPAATNIAPLLKRAFMFLEDGEWERADEFCEQVLNTDPECAQAYLGKLMAELHVKNQEDLKNCAEPFDSKNNYQKAVRFADAKLKADLIGCVEHICNRNELAHREQIYTKATNIMHAATTDAAFLEAAEMFESIGHHKDSATLAEECRTNAAELKINAEIARKDHILSRAKNLMHGRFSVKYEEALSLLQNIPGWKDADEQILICQQKIAAIKEQEEADRLECERLAEISRKANAEAQARKKKIIKWTAIVAVSLLAYGMIMGLLVVPAVNRAEAYKEYGEVLSSLNVGDVFAFGEYTQNGYASTSPEKIEWLVLDIIDEKALVISKYALDCQPFNTTVKNADWSNCTLRKWLNEDFIDAAFSNAEQSIISKTIIYAENNSSTKDKVFLLSVREAEHYFALDYDRQCSATSYAADTSGVCQWWLRSQATSPEYATFVFRHGSISKSGALVDSAICVRPAMWIDLSGVS